MAQDKNKIAAALSVEQLAAFVDSLAAKPGKERTLAAIQRAAAEQGITISLMSAKSFRDTTLDRQLLKIRNAQNIAAQVEAIEQGGNTLADASAKLLGKAIFETLLAADDEDGSGEPIDLESLTLAVSRLRRGNQQGDLTAAALAKAQEELKTLRAANAEREAKAAEVEADTTLDADAKAARWREIFGMA